MTLNNPIRIVTLIDNAEVEDLLIRALVSEGQTQTSLEFRALSITSLLGYLEQLDPDSERSLLIRNFGEGNQELKRTLNLLNNVVTLDLNPGASYSQLDLERLVNRALRETQSTTASRKKASRISKLVVVTGTSGSPGVTTTAINLASELARDQEVELIDRHPRRRDVAFLLGAKRTSERVKLSERLSIASNVRDIGRIQIIDAGPAPDLSSAFSDRRAPIKEYIELLEMSDRIVFLMNPENNHMFELEAMLASIEAGRLSAKTLFVLNQMGSSRRERSIQKRFLARVLPHYSLHLPFDREALDRAKAAYSALVDVAPKSRLRRSIQELSRGLFE